MDGVRLIDTIRVAIGVLLLGTVRLRFLWHHIASLGTAIVRCSGRVTRRLA